MTAADRTPHVRGVAPRPTSQLWGDKSPPSGAVRISSLRGALGGGPLRTGRHVCVLHWLFRRLPGPRDGDKKETIDFHLGLERFLK